MRPSASQRVFRAGEPRPTSIWQSDRFWAASIALASAGLFLVTFSPEPAFGDSAESIAGIASLGVLHAPGYPSYVLAGKLFTIIVPFGSLAFRVNLFSLVCASLTTAGVFLAARRLSASRAGAAFGAAAWATATSVWFYAGYAKPYAFTTLLLVAVLILVLDWRRSGGMWRMIGAWSLAGVAGGASYQAFALALPGLAVLVLVGKRRIRLKEAAAGAAAGVLVLMTMLSFVVLRARAEPEVNWGNAQTVSRLVRLETMRDFGFGTKSFTSEARQGTSRRGEESPPPRAIRILGRIVLYFQVPPLEFLPPVLLLAALGLVESWRRLPRSVALSVTLMFAMNVVVGTAILGLGPTQDYDRVLLRSAFFIVANLIIVLWAALGATRLVNLAGSLRDRLAEGTAKRGGRRGGRDDPRRARWLGWGAVAGLFLTVAWSILEHREPATHSRSPFVEDYAANVFDQIPQDSVLFVFGADRGFPLQYEQVVQGLRPDVKVLVGDLLVHRWYRDLASLELGREIGFSRGFSAEALTEFIEDLARVRPVFVDATLNSNLRRLNSVFRGLVAEVVPGTERGSIRPEELDSALGGYQKRGLYSDPAHLRYPNIRFLRPYAGTHAAAASSFFQRGEVEPAKRHARMALLIDPGNRVARKILERTTD